VICPGTEFSCIFVPGNWRDPDFSLSRGPPYFKEFILPARLLVVGIKPAIDFIFLITWVMIAAGA